MCTKGCPWGRRKSTKLGGPWVGQGEGRLTRAKLGTHLLRVLGLPTALMCSRGEEVNAVDRRGHG